MQDHKDAIKLVLETLIDETNGVIKSVDEISAVGHRVVHGGEYYSKSVLIDEKVMKALEDCSKLAPLHNPPKLSELMLVKHLCLARQWWQYLIQLFIKICQSMHIFIHYHMNYMKITK